MVPSLSASCIIGDKLAVITERSDLQVFYIVGKSIRRFEEHEHVGDPWD